MPYEEPAAYRATEDLSRKGDNEGLLLYCCPDTFSHCTPYSRSHRQLAKARQDTDLARTCVRRAKAGLGREVLLIRGYGVWTVGGTGCCAQEEGDATSRSRPIMQAKGENENS